MYSIRWLSVVLLTLATTSAAHAQSASFSVLGLSTLFGQAPAPEWSPSVLPWLPIATGNILGVSFPAFDDGDELEELPAPQPDFSAYVLREVNAFDDFVPECLACWKEQWSLGHYREAQMLATIACRLDPLNIAAQHARALTEVMQELATEAASQSRCAASTCSMPIAAQVAQALFGVEVGGTQVCAGSKPCAKNAGCCAANGAATTCQTAAAKEAVTCACASKPDCCCAKVAVKPMATTCACAAKPACCAEAAAKAVAKTCACAAKPDCCCAKPAAKVVAKTCACATKPDCCCAKPAVAACACAPQADACCCAPKPTAVKTCATNCTCSKKKAMTGLLPYPISVVPESVADCPFLRALHGMVGATHAESCQNPMVAMPPPVVFAHPLPMLPPGMSMPAQGFGSGTTPGLPTLAQVYRDLENVRAAAMHNARAVARVMEVPTQPVAKHNVHLVTPLLEAYCERLTSDAGNPDRLVLEGDVQVTCKRNGQSVRIQGQRVLVNLSEGTFTVESVTGIRSAPSTGRNAVPAAPRYRADFDGDIRYVQPPVPIEPTTYYQQPPAPYAPAPAKRLPVRPGVTTPDGTNGIDD